MPLENPNVESARASMADVCDAEFLEAQSVRDAVFIAVCYLLAAWFVVVGLAVAFGASV